MLNTNYAKLVGGYPSTGIIRRVDDLGRIVIPKNIRKELNIEDGEPMEFFLQEDCICLKKYLNTK